MIGRVSKLREDGKICWRPKASTTQHHLINWKVILWVVASLLTLVEDVFSEEDNKDAQTELRHVVSRPSWSPAEDLERNNSIHSLWPEVLEVSLMQEEELQHSRGRRSLRHPNSPKVRRKNQKKIKSRRDCHLEKKEMRVRDLGLGYDSDEIILFKYCVGACHSSRKNYDLALKALMDSRSISEKNVSGHPCCRPTRYETVSFMDTQTTWQTIKWLSAADCSCVG